MNREIRFKGRSKYNGKWVRGDLQTCYGTGGKLQTYIYDKHKDIMYRVIAKTVGQYIGMWDRNGCEIYEGDIIVCNDSETRLVVVWDITSSRPNWTLVRQSELNAKRLIYKHIIEFDMPERYEVIGNIHDKE